MDRIKTEFSSLGATDNKIKRLIGILVEATTTAALRPKKKRRRAKWKVWSADVQNAVKAKEKA